LKIMWNKSACCSNLCCRRALSKWSLIISLSGLILSLGLNLDPILSAMAQQSSTESKTASAAQAEKLIQAGNQLLKQSQPVEALKQFQQAATLYQQLGDRKGEAMALSRQGTAYFRLEQYPKAAQSFQAVLTLYEQLGDRANIGRMLNDLGSTFHMMEQYPQALDLLQKAWVIRREFADLSGQRDTLFNISLVYESLKQYPKAIETLQQSIAAYKAGKDRANQASTLQRLGDLFKERKNYQQALQPLQEALSLYRELNDRWGQGSSLQSLGNVYTNLKQFQQALNVYQQALSIAKISGVKINTASTLYTLGIASDQLKQHRQAIEYFQQALVIYRELKRPLQEADALFQLANSQNALENYPDAIKYYQQSVDIFIQLNRETSNAGSARYNLGKIFQTQQQYQKALNFLQEALRIYQKLGDRDGEADALASIADIYNQLGQYPQAIKTYEQTLKLYQATGERLSEGSILNNLGTVYVSLNQISQAISVFQRGLKIARELKDVSLERSISNNLSNIDNKAGKPQQALENYQKKLSVAKTQGDREGEGLALSNLGILYNNAKQYAKALSYLQPALVIYRSLGDRAAMAEVLGQIGKSQALSRQYVDAEKNLRESVQILETLRGELTDESKIALFETQSDIYRLLEITLVAQRKIDIALEVSESRRARAFAELLATQAIRQTSVPPKIIPPSIQQIRQIAQQQKATFVQYSLHGSDLLFIWVVQPSGNIVGRYALLKTPLVTQVNDSRQLMGIRGRGNITVTAKQNSASHQKLQALYNLLIQPIEADLPRDPNSRVIFIPQGELFQVPFAALQDSTGKSLIDRHTILTAPSIQVLQLTQQQRERLGQSSQSNIAQNTLVVGNPTMPQVSIQAGSPPEQLSSLPGAEAEAKNIAQLFKTQALTGKQATESAILQKLPRAKIIHLATHGLLDDFKEKGIPGAIALAPDSNQDGLLTSNEILDLNLQAVLVVLSACDTGRGRITGDGVIGLSRAWMSAGVPSVLVSLWAVDDASTAFLMTGFYKNWQQKGMDKAQSLRQAMLTTRLRYPNPKDWAAFTLMEEAE
jgi:CHAT domain-containing protein/uncharacterized protein HemY